MKARELWGTWLLLMEVAGKDRSGEARAVREEKATLPHLFLPSREGVGTRTWPTPDAIPGSHTLVVPKPWSLD